MRAARAEAPPPPALPRRSAAMDESLTMIIGPHPITRVTPTRHAAANRSDDPPIAADAMRARSSGASTTTASRIAIARPIPRKVPMAARISPSATN